MMRAGRRRWLRAGAALAATAGWLPLAGCSREPLTRLAGQAFGTPAELVLWGPDEDEARALAARLWQALDDFDRGWRDGRGEASAQVAVALAGTSAQAALPAPLPGADADIAWRGLGLDHAATQLKLAEGNGALLSLGQHLLAVGERGLRPWHVGVQDAASGQALAHLDLYAGERLVTVAGAARYRVAADSASPLQPPWAGAGECASCSVLSKGAGAARAARCASLLQATSRADWPARAAEWQADGVLWVGRDGRLEGDLHMAKRALPADQRRRISQRDAS